jgi:hypothetical protein
MFFKRHYEFIAEVLSRIQPPSVRLQVASEFAKAFKEDNRNFDTAKFIAAVRRQRGGDR